MNDQKFLSAKYWPLAAFHWVDIHNHTPNVNTGCHTPWELITKEKTTVSYQFLFKFGEPVCVPVVMPDKLWRFDAKGNLAYGQLLIKLVDELNQAKERLERVYNGKDLS